MASPAGGPIHSSNLIPSYFFETKKQTTYKLIDNNPLFPVNQTLLPPLKFSNSERLNLLLEEELDALIVQKEKQITQTLEKIDEVIHGSRFYKMILDFTKWAHEYADTGNDTVQNGIEYLQNLLPEKLIKEGTILGNHLESLDEIADHAGKFLNALDLGVSALVLMHKTKILEISKKVFLSLKNEYDIKKEMLQDKKISKSEQREIKKILATLGKIISELEIKLKIQEKQINLQKTKYQLKVGKKFFSFVKIPLKYLPIDQTTKAFQFLLTGVTVAKTALSLILSGFVLHRAVTNHCVYTGWTEAFKQWKNRQQPTSHIATQMEPPLQVQFPEILNEISEKNFQKFQEELDKLIYHPTMVFEEIKQELKNFGIELMEDINTTSELIDHWELHAEFKQDLIFKYTDFAIVLGQLDYLIQTSKNLLIKREAVTRKKVLQLTPHFEELKPKIVELKKRQYEQLAGQFRVLYGEKFSKKNLSPLLFENLPEKEIERILKEQEAIFNEQKIIKLQNIANQLQLGFTISRFKDKAHIINAFERIIVSDKQFDRFMKNYTSADLLYFYVDHQETLEHITKNSLKEMISKKHEIERNFTKFKLVESGTLFTIASIFAVISTTFAIIGLLTTPVAGAGFILIGLSIASTIFSLGFLGASYYQKSKYKSASTAVETNLTDVKLMFNRVRARIEEYCSLRKNKKLQDIAFILKNLHKKDVSTEEYQKAFKKYEEAKTQYALSQSKVQEWNRKIKAIQTRINNARLQDFAKSASLSITESPQNFDTWKALNESLLAMDLSLLSEETKVLLQTQLGLDIEVLQAQAMKNPESLKKALQKFFTLEDSEIVEFIQYQQARIQANLIPSMNPN
ncbi:hypothetical protein [Candidatus Protochlamydia sp. R18]|uniref:hypothetical protein n=1 Tax=Candidatus Protochlamydia sp. R18 TaxID=1353977 RepID=UPI0005AA5C2D|nr:hypothetical protein [Candidatus Protochlamydia sp. R18]